MFLVEGDDLVAAGLAAGLRPEAVFVLGELADIEADLAESGHPLAGAPVYVVDRRVAARLTTLETPAPLMAVFPLPGAPPLGELLPAVAAERRSPGPAGAGAAPAAASSPGPVVYADRLADPGNLGTLVRAAAAFAAAALVASPGSVDVFSPKVVRAGMGAVFDLPLYHEVPLDEAVAALGATRVYGLVAHGGRPLADVVDEHEAAPAGSGAPQVAAGPGMPPVMAFGAPAILVVGAERAGLSDEVLAGVTDLVTIPLPGVVAPDADRSGLSGAAGGTVESLNAGVAGAIALYELSRRRDRAAPPEE